MNCPDCGTANESSRKFCIECGRALEVPCDRCGTANPAFGKFCGECGAALAPQPSAVPSAVAGDDVAQHLTERRLVSVLFLDLVGFTSLSEHRDAEDVRSLLETYFEVAKTVIDRHGGVVEKFIGDAVMAVWGTPVTHEDDAERAVRAALELVDAVASLGEEQGAELRARCGVHTGEAATAQSIDHQGMVTGDMVNTASRFQSAAQPGSVLVGEATFRATSETIAYEPMGELSLKGKEAPTPAWRALRVVAERQGHNRMAVEPPFVGRQEELRLLKEQLHATGREGKSRIVSLTGVGGIGKSRLAWELLKYVDGLSETIWWHHGRCPSYGDGITFWALGEMVRMRAGIAETDAPGVSRAKLAASVAEHVHDAEERRWLEPSLAFLLGLDERPTGGRDELFAAWRTFFERISDNGTVAMVFEDLQWADSGLLDFIESLLEWSRGRPIFIVTLARPELTESAPHWGAGTRNFLSRHLEPLTDEIMAELVAGMVPGAGKEAIDRIVERAEGMPLYAVEMIRMLAGQGVLRLVEGSYELVGDLGELEVPETLHALIASRLDSLASGDRALLQDAAILGKSFTLDALSAVTGATPTELEPRLLDLTRREFLVHELDPRSPERGQYAFVQGIIREIAYGMLSRADRRARHLAVAHHFEAVGDDELAGVVASHYLEALRATPEGADREALSARARDWLAQAAERATELGSPEQALALADQALSITPAGRERAEILQMAAGAAGDALKSERQLDYLSEAVEVLGSLGDDEEQLKVMGVLACEIGDHNDVDRLSEILEQMRPRIGRTDSHLARAEFEQASAFLHYFEGDLESSLTCIDRALAGFEAGHATARFRKTLTLRANLLMSLGRHLESETLRRGMLAVANEENDLRTAATVLIGLSLEAEEIAEALELGMEAAAVARRGGCGRPHVIALANSAEMAVECGAWETAEEVIAELQSMTDLPAIAMDAVEQDRALLAAYRGEASAARLAMARVSEETTASADPTLRSWNLRVESVLLLFEGDLEAAYETAIAALDAEANEGANTDVASYFAGRAALWLGDAAKAREALDRMPVLEKRLHVAIRRALEAGLTALEGRPEEAANMYETVLAARLAQGDPFTHAFITLDAMAVLPETLVPVGAVDTAREYLSGLGAEGLLARLHAQSLQGAR
jgi:class 3 adenylate cyclase/tetratricopeptide (TPR) repeat protein